MSLLRERPDLSDLLDNGGELDSPSLPQPVPEPPKIRAPKDIPFTGLIRLFVDATDIERGIFHAREVIPVAAPGAMTLLYPKWLPGYHSPDAPIELFAGLQISAGGKPIAWRRDPVEMHAFHIEVPDGVECIEATFQFLSPTSSGQGRVVVTSKMLNLEWNTVLLYPAGYFARRIVVQPELTLPAGWGFASALDAEVAGSKATFEPVALDVLIDSPIMAGEHFRRIDLDTDGSVRLNVFADEPQLVAATDQQIERHRALVAETDELFGTRHFKRFEFLVALSDELGGIGVEHHECCEIATVPSYFTEWEKQPLRRSSIPHEYIHSWNGKFLRGADSWTASFERPIRNSLMWVYEGQTQYWTEVLAARAGLWSVQQALDSLAKLAATYDNRAGRLWRPMSDTTRDPIIAARQPLPWPSWQRSEDYYSEGHLLWLEVDTLIRELSADERSLDTFARSFFGQDFPGSAGTRTYEFEDVVDVLDRVAPFDWCSYLTDKLERRGPDAPLDGLKRGGYRLEYRETQNEFAAATDAASGLLTLTFSLGITVGSEGKLQEVLWGSPAFEARLTAASKLLAVNGIAYSHQVLKRAIAAAKEGGPLRLLVQSGKRHREVEIEYRAGHRYPHLTAIEGARNRLHEILAPRRKRDRGSDS
jgi:predicted metalloprotease with PDZ domain